MDPSSPKPFGRLLAELVIESGYVRKNHSPNWVEFAKRVEGVGYETLRKALSGERAPSPVLIERVARVLNVEPSMFIEYRFTQAHRELDPREVGWTRAVDALASWEAFRGSRSVERSSVYGNVVEQKL
jgi:transcriptional regulator with XRE-family HTH domain